MKQTITLTLDELAKTFGKRTLFSSISCRVNSGQCLAITGANGTGKTTLIKMIACLIKPSAGRIEIRAGQTRLEDAEQVLPYIGLASPEITFYSQLTATENIHLLAQMRDVALSTEMIGQSLAAVGLDAQNSRQIKIYSTGMKQRLKFALLQAIDPPLWLIDEGLSNLDKQGRTLILSLIEKAILRQRLLVLATNEQADAVYASQTIALPQH